MKKIMFALVIIALSVIALPAQTVDGVNLAEKREVEYLEIVGFRKGFFKKKLLILVDYGQKVRPYKSNISVVGADGKSVVFNSMMDALNRFNGWGWEMAETYAITEYPGKVNVLRFVMRRKKG